MISSNCDDIIGDAYGKLSAMLEDVIRRRKIEAMSYEEYWKQVVELAQARQSRREYASGEACYLWGKPYMLQVIREGHCCRIEKAPNRIIMKVPEGASEESSDGMVSRGAKVHPSRYVETVQSGFSLRCLLIL